jgi:hypothetical protein
MKSRKVKNQFMEHSEVKEEDENAFKHFIQSSSSENARTAMIHNQTQISKIFLSMQPIKFFGLKIVLFFVQILLLIIL